MQQKKIHLIGYASGVAGVDSHAGDGPLVMQKSLALQALQNHGYSFQWGAMIHPKEQSNLQPSDALTDVITQVCSDLATAVSTLTTQQAPFTVIGGDHTAAIGTWSGVYHAMHEQGDIGLIWIDAHMDSHTPETSESGRIHGMPVACLLGYGNSSLTSILQQAPKIKPENICFIGVRSYEKGEAEFLAKLNVRIYFMDEVKKRGLVTVLKEAVKQVSAHTIGYGLSIDLDAIDPAEAPGVDVPEPDGIHAADLIQGLTEIAADTKLIATEIVEFDPSRDKNKMTENIVASLLEAIHGK